MKTYVITTGAIFGLLTLVHIWRLFAEDSQLAKHPAFFLITVVAAALCLWACRLLKVLSRSGQAIRLTLREDECGDLDERICKMRRSFDYAVRG